ncbi:MAG TPA: DUF2911 domain-containing protein [Thermoanaerobaculia bacterium]
MRKAFVIVVMLIATTAAFGQVQAPRPSPKASLTQAVGITDITINYNRPGVRGRQIWGGLVPYDQVWRTGANEATTISFSNDVVIDGQKLPKGMYSLHTIPGREEWTVIFNSVAEQWGSYSYDAANDKLRIKVKPQQADFREWLSFDLNEMTTDTAKIAIRWDRIAVPFTVDTKSTERTIANFRNAMQPDWRTPYMAASFAFENPGAAADAEMNAWLDQSMKANQNIANLWLKARIMEKQGNKAEAIRYGEMAFAAATPQQGAFASEVRKNVDNWKK